MQDHVSTLYPISPSRMWRKKHTNKIRILIQRYAVDFDRVFLAGHSMGAEFIFLYCNPLIDGLVCYSGLHNTEFRAKTRPPTLYVTGKQERLPTKKHTIKMYEEDLRLGYVSRLLEHEGGHAWNPDLNPLILSTMNEMKNEQRTIQTL